MDKDRVAGSAKKIKGSIKEVVGEAAGTLEVEGKADKGEGKVQSASVASKTRSNQQLRRG